MLTSYRWGRRLRESPFFEIKNNMQSQNPLDHPAAKLLNKRVNNLAKQNHKALESAQYPKNATAYRYFCHPTPR